MDDRFERATLFSGVATSSECTGGWGGGGESCVYLGGGVQSQLLTNKGQGCVKKAILTGVE